jgi:hypothetical protein
MILEGIVTTLNPDGTLNVAPMGPDVEPDVRAFVLRPFKTAATYRNLKVWGEGVLHVTDDVLLLAESALGRPAERPTKPATRVQGRILLDACRYYEFRVAKLDDKEERVTIRAETVAWGRQRDVFGFNRGKHAVVEAAILATRTEFLPLEEVLAEFRKLLVLVDKTGGSQERAAFDLLFNHVRAVARARGVDTTAS